MADFSYTVNLIKSEDGSKHDITNLVTGIPRFTDIGLDQINAAEISFTSPSGELLTKAPVIEDYDRVEISASDSEGRSFYNQYEYAPRDDALDISETKRGGRRVHVKLLGLEYHLTKINYAFPHRYESGEEVITAIAKYYNDNRGSKQPELRYIAGGMPSGTANTYPYDDTPETCYDRIRDLANSFGAPPADGGLLDFYTVEFFTTADGKLNLSMRSLGDNKRVPDRAKAAVTTGTDVVLTEGELPGDDEDRDLGISPPRANRIIGIFDRQSGTLPVNFSRFAGRSLRYEFLPLWRADVDYIVGEEVRTSRGGVRSDVYRCIGANRGNRPPSPNWRTITHDDYLDAESPYSPWTENRLREWENSAAGLGGGGPLGGACFTDFNTAIAQNPTYRRYPVDYVGVDPSGVPSRIRLGNGRFYRGFRILVNGTGRGDLDGMKDVIAEYDGTRWFTRYSFDDSDDGAAACVDMNEAQIYLYDNGWTKTYNAANYDCLHQHSGISLVHGVRGAGTHTLYQRNRAIEVTYDLEDYGVGGYIDNTLGVGLGNLFLAIDGSNKRVKADYFRSGVSIRIPFPFPSGSRFSPTSVGGIYGGGNRGEPATLNISNNRYTSGGNTGYNHSDSEDLGAIDTIDLILRAGHFTIDTNDKLPITPEVSRYRGWLRDCVDNVIIQDFTLPFNDVWTNVSLPISSFVPYNAHAPKLVKDFFVPPKEQEELNRFRYWDIKEFGITWLGPYDDESRYSPADQIVGDLLEQLGRTFLNLFGTLASTFGGRRVKLAIDGVRFGKELIVVSDRDQERNLEKVIRIPRITTYTEGRYYVESEQERLRFRNKEYTIDVKGRFDVHYGDTIYYENPAVISDSDGRKGRIKLAVMGMEHSITPGVGLRSKIVSIKRFE